MKISILVFCLTVAAASVVVILQAFESQNDAEIFLDKSGPYVGVEYPQELGYDGDGIKIAVIDTGIDFTHPDLRGFGNGDKVIGGYNFVDNGSPPTDTNGHGTEVAGIIAADGQLSGIAPKASLLAYKVSEDGDSVSSDSIIKAIDQAIIDDADIINISLGVNRTNSKIDDKVNQAIQSGIVVVTAAGNDGPNMSSIGSPGKNSNSITVGATYNNITSSLVSTFEIEEKQFEVLPMLGVDAIDEPIVGEIKFGGYGRERDLTDSDYSDSILLVERGSDVEGEIVYFSDKEFNAANAGAKAIIVYNNQPGMFLGELLHEFTPDDYYPRIPSLSMSRDDGLGLKETIQELPKGALNLFYNPDFVAHFSSRGPVSPFFIKPDLVAPGAFINTTMNDGLYNFTSGTSFAAPHVSGAAALLLQKYPDFSPEQIKSILVTTTDPVSDAYGSEFPLDIAGSGRLNIQKAFDANLVIIPSQLIFNLSIDKITDTKSLQLEALRGDIGELSVSFEGPEFVQFAKNVNGNLLDVALTLTKENFGSFDAKLNINNQGTHYKVPVIIHVTQGTVFANEKDGKLNFEISHPEPWAFAKISVTNKVTGSFDTTSATPNKQGVVEIYEDGEYFVEANINVNGETFDAFETISVNTATGSPTFLQSINIPERPLIIVFAIMAIVSIVGLKMRK